MKPVRIPPVRNHGRTEARDGDCEKYDGLIPLTTRWPRRLRPLKAAASGPATTDGHMPLPVRAREWRAVVRGRLRDVEGAQPDVPRCSTDLVSLTLCSTSDVAAARVRARSGRQAGVRLRTAPPLASIAATGAREYWRSCPAPRSALIAMVVSQSCHCAHRCHRHDGHGGGRSGRVLVHSRPR